MPPLQPTGFVENLMLSHVAVLKRWHKGKKGVKIAWTCLYDVLVAIAMAYATMTAHWVCEEYDAESCDSVETVAQ